MCESLGTYLFPVPFFLLFVFVLLYSNVLAFILSYYIILYYYFLNAFFKNERHKRGWIWIGGKGNRRNWEE